jgi:hypothetical protein
LRKKRMTETASFASFLDIYLIFDTNGQLFTSLNDKRDDFNFGIINCPRIVLIY